MPGWTYRSWDRVHQLMTWYHPRASKHPEAEEVALVETVVDPVGLVRAAAEHRPDAVLTDIRMPPTFTTEGIDAAKRIRAEHPSTGVVVLSHYVEEDYAFYLLSDGVAGLGYLLKERVSRLDEVVMVFAVIDHAAAAQTVGLSLRDTALIVFGNPAAGSPVMAAAPLAGLDLPLKALICDDAGTTRISYYSPATIAERHHLERATAAGLSAIDVLTDAVLKD